VIRHAGVDDALRAAASTSDVVAREIQLGGGEGRSIRLHAVAFPQSGPRLGTVAVFHDMTELRRLEAVRRDFVANVSHELKTPLTAIRGFAETLLSVDLPPEDARKYLGVILRHAERLGNLIDDLLDLSRIESEEAPPREPVLVNLVMADAIERVRATADQRGIEILLHEPSPPVAVMGDRRQLVSAMHALLENAITYSYDNSKVDVSGMVQRVNPIVSRSGGKVGNGQRDGGREANPLGFDTGEVILGDLYGTRTGAEDKDDGDKNGAGAAEAGSVEGSLPVTPAEGTKLVETIDAEAREAGERGEGPVKPVFTPEILENFTSPAETPAAAGTTVPPVASAAGPPSAAEGGEAVAVTETTSSVPNWRIEERDNVRISVQDHGIGIPARDLDRIFERFYRVDHGRSRDTGGTGLGLSIVRHVANNHQGWVDVESREGEGSTFTLVLPVQGQGERVV